MRLMAISDLHIGKAGWGDFGFKVLEKAIQSARENPIDVLIMSGDLVDPDAAPTVRARLELLDDVFCRVHSIYAKKHLWVLGNNDLECVMSPATLLSTVESRLYKLGQKEGIHVLDFEPVIVNDVAFVGGFGGFDGSLWRTPVIHSPHHPSTKEEMLRNLLPADLSVGADMSGREYFAWSQSKLHQQIKQVEQQASKLVVITHTVPTPQLVLYGATPAYDHQNAWMGWDDDLSPRPIHTVPNLVLQLCGHTHRSGKIERPGKAPLHNVSGQEQPTIFEV